MKADPKLKLVIKRIGACELHAVAPKDPFVRICKSDRVQQLSIKAAATIFGALRGSVPDRTTHPERVHDVVTTSRYARCGSADPRCASSRTWPALC
jgi:3-methyladenine DNA glycosylase/8-oxoguanine DNA glycosylase